MNCSQCDALYINGVKCHETGCPIAWQDTTRECKWCGAEFVPAERDQQYCNVGCYRVDIGF